MVGLNRFAEDQGEPVDYHSLQQIDPALERAQREKLARVRRERSDPDVRAALEGVRRAIRDGDNVMPTLVDAMRQYATVGEVCRVMREEWGEFQPSTEF